MTGQKVVLSVDDIKKDIVINEKIKNPFTYILSSINDFKYINKPFMDMNVTARPTDIDFCLERKRCFIFGEFKKIGKNTDTGQTILLEQLQKLNKDFRDEFKYKIECLVVWVEEEDGLYKKPIRYKRYRCDGKIDDVKENVIDSLNLYFINWFDTVDKFYKE